MSDEAERVRVQRAQAILSACGVAGVVERVERLAGQSHISWRAWRIDAPSVAIRMEPQRGILPPYDLPAEARLLGQLAQAGVPVPRVLGVSAALTALDDPARGCLITEWVDGDLLSKQHLTEDAARAYCETLRRIHTLDWRAAGLTWLPQPPASGPALRERAEIATRLQAFGVDDLPHIRRLREALDGRVPDSPTPMLVHGDVNFGNVILRIDDAAASAPRHTPYVAAVLDWEQAHLGDPLSDWGRLAAEDLLGNLDLSERARQVMQDTLRRYDRSPDDRRYWTLHQLYKHASATGALSVLRGWDIERIAKLYEQPMEQALSR